MAFGPDSDGITEWLLSFVRSEAPRGEGVRRASALLLKNLGNPQDRVPAVHIVGTAGKGSVASLLTDGLVAGGSSVATHMSPHVHDIRERFLVDGRLPPWDEVAAAATEVAAAADEPTSDARPTFFALTSALAFVLGRRASTDWVVVEAGIGGRVDATNVFERGDVLTVITAIGLDHTEVLGETVEQIAAEKAAVLEGRTHAVLGPQPHPKAAAVVRAIAATAGVELVEVAPTGEWRSDALATALAAGDLLGQRTGVAMQWPSDLRAPGRYECHRVNNRLLIFDGAHNPLKLAALAGSLPVEPIHAVVAIGANKDLLSCVTEIAAFADIVTVVGFGPDEFGAGPRSWPPDQVCAAFRRAGVDQVAVAAEPAEVRAILSNERAGLNNADEPTTVVVTGSVFHLADMRRALVVDA